MSAFFSSFSPLEMWKKKTFAWYEFLVLWNNNINHIMNTLCISQVTDYKIHRNFFFQGCISLSTIRLKGGQKLTPRPHDERKWSFFMLKWLESWWPHRGGKEKWSHFQVENAAKDILLWHHARLVPRVCLPLMQRHCIWEKHIPFHLLWSASEWPIDLNCGKLSADRCLGLLPVCECQPHHAGWSLFLCSCLCLRVVPVRACSFEIKVCWNSDWKTRHNLDLCPARECVVCVCARARAPTYLFLCALWPTSCGIDFIYKVTLCFIIYL